MRCNLACVRGVLPAFFCFIFMDELACTTDAGTRRRRSKPLYTLMYSIIFTIVQQSVEEEHRS